MTLEAYDRLKGSLEWFGIDDEPSACDVCENGSAWYALTQILPKGSLDPADCETER